MGRLWRASALPARRGTGLLTTWWERGLCVVVVVLQSSRGGNTQSLTSSTNKQLFSNFASPAIGKSTGVCLSISRSRDDRDMACCVLRLVL